MILAWIYAIVSLCFNPRAPGGARLNHDMKLNITMGVSIHAPPEGRDGKMR